MAAGWKKIILTDLEAHLNEVSSSGYIWTSASLSSDASDNVLVRDSVTGEVRVLSQSVVGGEGSSLLTFATMSAGGVNITSSAVGTLFITSSDGNPLTVVGTQDDTITIATDTASLETVQDTTAAMLTGGNLNYSSYSLNHQDITFNYDDAGNGTFSIIGSSAITSSNTTGQQGVELILTEDGANVELSAFASGLSPSSSVTFNSVTASNFQFTTSNIVSASSLYVTESTYLQSDLTMSGDFIFQGFKFGDAQVLVHSGSNIFGSGSENDTPHPTQNNHQFTGSIFVTGSGITLESGSTSGPNSFYGDGSGLTNLPTESLPSGLLSSSQQISASISGAFSTDQITLQTASNSSGVISALTATITDNESALATGGQIYSFWNTTSGSFLAGLSGSLITDITASHLGGMRIMNSEGPVVFNPDTEPFIHIDNLASVAIQSQSDSILFEDVSISNGLNSGEDGFKNRKIQIANFAAFITSSVGYPLGTVTGITAGNGITVDSSTSDLTVSINLSGSEYTSDVGADSTLYHDSNLIANANNLALRSKIKLDTLTAPTASFAYLKAYDADSLVALNSTTVTVDDNFIIMNTNATAVGEDGGITIKRGLEDNANLFWNEASKRWSINNTDLDEGSTTASPDSYIITATGTTSSPADSFPTYGNNDGTNAEGSIHINTNASTPEVWIWA